MTTRPVIDLSAQPSLFLTDEQLWPIVAPHLSRIGFHKLALELETRGFPKIDALFKGRYVPAVRAWLDARAGLGKVEIAAVDGPETWDEAPANDTQKRLSRPHLARPRRGKAALLERGQPVAQGPLLPGQVDPFTARRHGG